jgi:hypothetical protein
MKPVLSVTVYKERMFEWFKEGGKRGCGILSRTELAKLAYRDLHRYFHSGDLDPVIVGKGIVPKWRNQLAFALVSFHARKRTDAKIVRAGSWYYWLDLAEPIWMTPVKKCRKIKRTRKRYRYIRRIQP